MIISGVASQTNVSLEISLCKLIEIRRLQVWPAPGHLNDFSLALFAGSVSLSLISFFTCALCSFSGPGLMSKVKITNVICCCRGHCFLLILANVPKSVEDRDL